MLLTPSPKSRRRRRTARRKANGPILVAATYSAGGPHVIIQFDRAMDLSAFDASRIRVNDPVTNHLQYEGVGSFPTGVHAIHVNLGDTGAASGTKTVLTILRGNGVLAVDNRAEVAPVDNVELPYP